MIVYNNQQQLTGHCSFQEYSVLLQSPPRNNGNQGQHAIILFTMIVRSHRARKSRTTLQNKVRLKVLPEQLTLFVNTSVTVKNASFNSFLLYRPDYCSEIHALSYTSKEKYR